METVSIRTPLEIHVAGAPDQRVEQGASARSVAALPEKIPLIKPRLMVKKGERVKIGSPLFENKLNTRQRFLSPGGGIIADIRYGYRRGIAQVRIDTDMEEAHELFEPMDEQTITKAGRDRLIDELLDRGLWPLIRNLPYRSIASPHEKPASVWVGMDSADPFQVPSNVYLKGEDDVFVFGIRILQAFGVPVFICESSESPITDRNVASLVTHRVSGRYPMEDPGVILYHTKKSSHENLAWYMSGQDLVVLARGLRTGRYPTSRIVAVSGFVNNNGVEPETRNNRYVQSRTGAPLQSLVHDPERIRHRRWITGGLFRGQTTSPDNYMGFYENSLILVEEAQDPELFGFLKPGFSKPTASRTFLSAFRKKPFPAKADMRGETRACINCGRCAWACPVGILVQFTYKAIYAGEIEDAIMHGLLDCVECGLCSYVCPAKIELTETLISSRHAYYRERI